MPPKTPQGPEHRIPQPAQVAQQTFQAPARLEVRLPAGGTLTLNTPEEVVMWNETRDRYIRDYNIDKANDLMLLGAILSQALMMYRAQRDLSDEKKAPSAQAMITKAAEEIRKGEKALGIDKATREKGGAHTVADYLTRLKRAGYAKGVHISERVKEYERVMMEARWKIRVLRNGDAEDRSYHKLSERSIIDWLEKELRELEEKDKLWAREQSAVWVGTL